MSIGSTIIRGSALPTEFTTTSTGTVNNLDFSGAAVIRCNNATALTLTGLLAGYPGQTVTIVSVGAGNVFLSYLTGSSAGNQLSTLVQSGPGTPLAAGVGVAVLQYDSQSALWRLINHVQGAAIAPTFAAGNFTASGTMTWTVASGDVSGYTYYIQGRQLFFSFELGPTTITAPLSNQCRVLIPGGFTSVVATQGYIFIIDNGTFTSGRFYVGSSTQIYMEKGNNANYVAATDATYFGAQGVVTVQ